MTSAISTTEQIRGVLIQFVSILLSCFLLFYIDSDTEQVFDLFEFGNLLALAIYFLPTFMISMVLFAFLAKRYGVRNGLIRFLVIGIPLSFTLIITMFLCMK
ncbi:hypothetical protein [Flavipsychrobacter stenotrophus]|nr:hypothetical protein [Flavipsychrobacter stenotrophus]